MSGERHRAKVKVEAGGRVLITAKFREASGIKPGDTLVLEMEEPGVIRAFTVDAAVRQIQELIGRYVPGGRMLSEELIAERRAEADRE